MALKFKKTDQVVQVVAPIEGTVIDQMITDDEVKYLVSWTDAQGNQFTRWFGESELALK